MQKKILKQLEIKNVITAPTRGIQFFEAPHEAIKPLFMADPPEENGIHYLHTLTHPGDSHTFRESMPILALPVSAPWGSTVDAAKLALMLRPKYVIPIHDWHWNDQARDQMYVALEASFKAAGIIFIKTIDGEPFVINLDQ